MNLFLRIDNNIIAIVVSIIFLRNITNSLDKKETKNRIFVIIFIINTVQLFIETSTCIINKQPYTWLIPISAILHIFLYILGPIVTYMWYVFANLWVNKNKNYKWKNNIIFLLPIGLNILLAILSPFFKLEFYIDKFNVYQRGFLFFVPSAISYFYLLCGFIIIYTNRNKLTKIEFLPLLLFGVFPSIASLIQIMIYGPLLMWSSIAFSLIILYLYIQQQMIHIDHLTGAWTRDKFYNYLNYRIKQKKPKNFSIAFIDLNDFKKINDTFGHNEGDNALINVVHIIKDILKREDFITRYGGDEFVLFLNADSEQQVEETINKVYDSLAEYNENSRLKYKLNLSCGYELYDFNKHMTADEYISHVDKLMYRDKKIKKLKNKVSI
ncbi:GGDEF domain-containing protein [Clostridium scatologenes]|uniref:Diguanylate cyclase (GGDEF) domain protein n=1 Tax=Clostridium scatologenes TaxID=1548 RepID=A0A0E3JMF7_CLOSL|nr:GGDEF domain-containing protein [Clostridium scatologenes]AKA67998.1 diguanylate cyclase (GGDEF) domain protein [Clostridium scatologenes]